ncbi:Ribose xylose arabinose galactoside ABC-type transport system, permease component [Paucilactobacillus oligofermentans DSM 15707 = LMG 22743]|uniref:Ribose xylose arabinose galactoside ABC-type transport system, permease component n=1 Tax=Paucilactobacillus oligofermentans DSM 15707 = LMG 22743 TaxID=1423778 RepID=A0A0R1RPR7_9LACO|nr:ribose ABC transporter permease [Paucilactobacillus oligofermentans]KRL55256.1 Ribose xylose arabinose galactoside ABC-type transport system, permease component [Paucilactobacillus oligofermentans DSM 15707 = LMG 22743]CUS25754.1 Ribose transport system permease protein RbsC [Paucilactobacillus oligofermentans DSM 15707 = LMG 22743]
MNNAETKKKFSIGNFYSKLGPLVALLVLVIFVSVLNSSFLNINNIMNLLQQISINALIAFGMQFVILTAGIDLSVGSILALSGAFMAQLILMGCPPIFAFAIGMITGAIFGAVNGVLIAYGKAAPFIATLATSAIFRGATYVLTNGNPITGKTMNNDFSFLFLGQGYLFGVPFQVYVMVVLYALAYLLLHKTTFGRKTYAVGGNEKAAFVAGVNTKKITIWIYIIAGFLSSVAGMILTSQLSSAQPDAGTGYEMDAIAAVVLGGTSLAGGKGKMFGTLIGALIIGVLNNGMNLLGISSFYQQIVKGIVILIAVLLDRKQAKA